MRAFIVGVLAFVGWLDILIDWLGVDGWPGYVLRIGWLIFGLVVIGTAVAED
jgi:hypothetical protein